jgi:putative membrane protein
MEITWANLGWTLAFTGAGLVLMFLGLVMYDILVPFKLFQEVERGNEAVSWLVAGFLISTGIILGSAFTMHMVFLQAVVYGVVGIVLNYVGYFAWELATPKWSLSDAIAKGSTAAGKVMFGIAIAIGLIISGSMS